MRKLITCLTVLLLILTFAVAVGQETETPTPTQTRTLTPVASDTPVATLTPTVEPLGSSYVIDLPSGRKAIVSLEISAGEIINGTLLFIVASLLMGTIYALIRRPQNSNY